MYWPKRILFLDIDGVIMTNRCFVANFDKEDAWEADELAVRFLKRFCYKKCYQIVISSSWKHLFNNLFKLLHETGLVYSLMTPDDIRKSCTPTVYGKELTAAEKDVECWGRGNEIREYLKSIDFDFDKDEAIIIDDDSYDVQYWDQFDNFKFIHTDNREGMKYQNMKDMLDFTVYRDTKTKENRI